VAGNRKLTLEDGTDRLSRKSVTKLHDITENLRPQINLFCISFPHIFYSLPEASQENCLCNILITRLKWTRLAV